MSSRPPELVTVKQAIVDYGLSFQTINGLIRERVLKKKKKGRTTLLYRHQLRRIIRTTSTSQERPSTRNDERKRKKWKRSRTLAEPVNRTAANDPDFAPIRKAVEEVNKEMEKKGGAKQKKKKGGGAKKLPLHLARIWAGWDSQPALGYRIRQHNGPYTIDVSDDRCRRWRGLIVSLTDLRACAKAWRNPIGFPFPGNPGVWTAAGVFRRDDGELCYEENYIRENQSLFGPEAGGTGQPHDQFELLVGGFRHHVHRLEKLTVTWPSMGRWGWNRIVYTGSSLKRLARRQRGEEDGGKWIDAAKQIWTDREGIWYSTQYIAEQTRLPVRWVGATLRLAGLVSHFTSVPAPVKIHDGRGRPGRTMTVYHQDDIHPLLGIGGTLVRGEPVTEADSEPSQRPRKPTRAGRYLDPRLTEILVRVRQLRANGVAWKNVTTYIKDEFGRTYAASSLERYLRRTRVHK